MKQLIDQPHPLSYPIGTIPPSSSGAAPHSSSSQPSASVHSTTPSSQQMMVMLPLHGGANVSATGTGGATAVAGAHLVSTDEVISMLQQQHILQVVILTIYKSLFVKVITITRGKPR